MKLLYYRNTWHKRKDFRFLEVGFFKSVRGMFIQIWCWQWNFILVGPEK